MNETDTLRTALTDLADGATLRPADLGTVRRRATRIRRRRTAATLAGAALVVAAVIPLGVGLGRSLQGPRPVSPATPGPTPSTTQAPPTVRPSSLESVPAGAPARLPYALGTTLHLVDGSTIDASRVGDITSWTPYGDGYLAEAGNDVGEYHRNGILIESWTPGSPLVLSPDRRRVAWAHGGGVTTGRTTGGPTVEHDFPFALSLAGFLPHGAFAVNSNTTPVVLRASGRVDDLPTAIAYASSASPRTGLVAGRGRSGNTAIVVDSATGRTLWQDRVHALGRFSPDGRLVWAVSSVGGPLHRVDLLDARTGAVVAALDLRGAGRVRHVSWEDDRHVLVVTDDPHAKLATALRFGADRSLDRALPLRSTDLPGAYYFAATP